MIVDNAGQLVWFRPLPGIQAATDFRAQTYQGKPVLTYWQGTSRQGIGTGKLVILDQTYRVIRTDPHRPTASAPTCTSSSSRRSGTALFITYPIVAADLTEFGGSRRGRLVDSVIQEVDIATGLVVFEWHSYGKISVRESFSKPVPSPHVPLDYAHTNSVERRHRRRPADVGPQHVDGLQDRPRDRRDPLAPGRQARGLQARGRRALRLAARRSPAQRRRADAVRQLRVPAGAQALARARAAARRDGPHGHAAERAPAPARAARRDPGQRAGAAGRRLAGRLGLAALLHGVLAQRRRAVGRAAVASATRPTGPTACRGSGTRSRRRARASPGCAAAG